MIYGSFINTIVFVHNSWSDHHHTFSYLSHSSFHIHMKMRAKAVIFLFVLLLAALFSSLPSTIAVPSSRSLKSISDENTSNHNLYREFKKNERMDIEVADYSGTGANNHHDPRSPPGSF